ncbi:sensor histidine kinase [Paraflavitalea sp. CAU 1676]|uniref:sensor histidine kinase n=1 Tax=Paraflavitalea sp. CAU 1676 TaxID=3032598 RepID=UPI0023D9C42B|nr:sensor histidine kinase [Paraflavitalea sp. CAU 1676]MDF2188761.1 histidine kinase [Paraflavitalea sp. CAU 1676]
MRDHRKAILVLIYTLLSIAAYSQEYSYARYGVKDGLAGTVVYHGLQDKEGFLWFATETGVSRFDGTQFKNFAVSDGLPDNEVLKLFVDSRNRVWMMPFRSAVCYYWKGKIYNQENDSILKKLSFTDRIVDIVEDNSGDIIMVSSTSILSISSKGLTKSFTTVEGKTMSPSIGGISADGTFEGISSVHGFAYINSVKKITFDANKTKLQSTPYPCWPAGYHNYLLTPSMEVYQDQDSLVFINRLNNTRSALLVPPQFISLSTLHQWQAAINTAHGTYLYDLRTHQLERHCLKEMMINGTFRDSEGNYWFVTNGEGVIRISSFEFRTVSFTDNNNNNLGVFSITRIGEQLLVGTSQLTLWTLDAKTLHPSLNHRLKTPTHGNINAILSYDSNQIIFGSDMGLYKYTPSGNMVNCQLAANSTKSIMVHNDSFLVSTNQGVFEVGRRLSDYNWRRVWHGRSTCSYVQGGTYYVGTLSGLHTVDSLGQQQFLGDSFPIFKSRIAAIAAAADGTLWIATNGRGIVGFRNGQIIHTIKSANGLVSDICRTLFVAGNYIWVGTDKGLSRIHFDKGKPQITNLTSSNGLAADMVTSIHVQGSHVYVGSAAGVTYFDNDKLALNSYCHLRITGIEIAGKTAAAYDTSFTLPHAQNAIRFEFVGISYRSAGDVTYRYRLQGLNDTWQTTRANVLSYPSLPSGHYELQLQAINKFGVASEMVHITFEVEKTLWENNWIRLLLLVLTGCLVWMIVYTRVKRIRKLNEEKIQINSKMADLEQMALKAQMNPHFIFNSLNSVQQYVIDKDLRGANKFITEFSRLIRLTLDISSQAKISLEEEINYLTTYLELEKTKFEDQFTYSVEVAPEVDIYSLDIPPMILQPYVENSIRHGVRHLVNQRGHITVRFFVHQDYLVCQVEDNGVGRRKASQYKSQIVIEYQSKGMSLTARRIDMLNRNSSTPVLIEILDLEKDGLALGTRVLLQFPLADAGKS